MFRCLIRSVFFPAPLFAQFVYFVDVIFIRVLSTSLFLGELSRGRQCFS